MADQDKGSKGGKDSGKQGQGSGQGQGSRRQGGQNQSERDR